MLNAPRSPVLYAMMLPVMLLFLWHQVLVLGLEVCILGFDFETSRLKSLTPLLVGSEHNLNKDTVVDVD